MARDDGISKPFNDGYFEMLGDGHFSLSMINTLILDDGHFNSLMMDT